MANVTGLIVTIMVAAIILFSAALPTIIEAKGDIEANLTTGEKNVAKLITLFLLLGVVFVVGRGLGMF